MLAYKHVKEAVEDDVAHGWTPTHATDDHGNWLDAEALAAKKNLTNMVHAIRLHHLGITTAALIAFAYRHNCWHMKTEEVCIQSFPLSDLFHCHCHDLLSLKHPNKLFLTQ